MFAARKTDNVSSAANYIEECFSVYLYTGNGSTQTITNGIDLAGKGGMVWLKPRSEGYSHKVYDTVRGVNTRLLTNTTDAGGTGYLTSFNSDGFSKNYDLGENTNGQTYVAWTFREQAKFFDVVTYTGNGSNRTIAHNLGSVPGCIIVKRTDTTGAWQVYHRSLANTEYLVLNTTAAKATGTTRWNSTTPTSTEFSLGTDTAVNANSGTYVAYLFAHDAGGFGATGTDNVISCGSFTTNGSGVATVDLGYEPQFILFKRTDSADNWEIADTMRGFSVNSNGTSSSFKRLNPNTSDAETTSSNFEMYLTSTGFKTYQYFYNATYIYIAIRRGPMKTPTSGTSVFTPNVSTTTDITGETFTVGFPPDSVWPCRRNDSSKFDYDRLRGQNYLVFNTTGAENNLDAIPFDQQNSFKPTYNFYQASPGVVLYSFRRAPGFFDVVCYTGTGSNTTITHNLGATPELMIVKKRQVSSVGWVVYSAALGATERVILNLTDAKVTSSLPWNNTAPTSTVFSLGTATEVNGLADTFVAYLFATVAGVSKVGSYTGTGTTKQIDCGFTAGARFVMIKRTDSTGDWYVWDTARGIVSGNDPYLLLNSTAAEVTSTDYIDPLNAGFEISSTAPAAINANGGTFIFLAIA